MIKSKKIPTTLNAAGGYACHSDKTGLTPQKPSYIAASGNEIKTSWQPGCHHITSDTDPGCDGCMERRA